MLNPLKFYIGASKPLIQVSNKKNHLNCSIGKKNYRKKFKRLEESDMNDECNQIMLNQLGGSTLPPFLWDPSNLDLSKKERKTSPQ